MHNTPPHIVSILPIEGTEAFEDGRMLQTYKVEARSNITGRTAAMEMRMSEEQLSGWANGDDLIQNCLPQLSPDEKEFLLSGITPEEWTEFFTYEEEE